MSGWDRERERQSEKCSDLLKQGYEQTNKTFETKESGKRRMKKDISV